MKRIANGFYLTEEKPNYWLAVMKDGRKWKYARIYLRYRPTLNNALKSAERLHHTGYPTRAMAISAAKGNRVP